MAFGKYPEVPLALARERHAEARKLLAIGLDPMAKRKAAKTAEKAAAENSFRTIARLWFYHWRTEKSARHVDATRRRMDANIFPLLGARPITETEAPASPSSWGNWSAGGSISDKASSVDRSDENPRME
jgi:hypothetical protein